jgi:hypothetical protein
MNKFSGKILKKIGVIALTIGIIIGAYSLTLNPYSNEQEFNEKYMALNGAKDASEKFFNLRDEYLTPKFELENYAITFCIIGIIIFLIGLKKSKIFRVPSKNKIFLIGMFAALLTVVGYVGDLFLETYRESAPIWADSIGIPLMGVPYQLIIFLIWAGINSLGLLGKFKTGVDIFPIKFENLNYWYAFISVITIVITLLLIASAYFWQIIPGLLWLYFYLSILSGRRVINITTSANTC